VTFHLSILIGRLSNCGEMDFALDLWLELMAKFTLLVAFLVVVYVFMFTTYRIARVRMPTNGWPLFHLGQWGQRHFRREIEQEPTQLPFTFNLFDSSTCQEDSFTFRLQVSGQHGLPPRIKCLWGPDVAHLFKLINSPTWDCLFELENLELPNTTENQPILHVESIKLVQNSTGSDFEVTVVKPPTVLWSSICGKYKYPLALFFTSEEEMHNSHIVGLSTILHVKSQQFPRSTSVLAQYIKMKDGNTHRLQPLYVVDGNSEAESLSSINSQTNESTDQPFATVTCTVCQAAPVSRAIVPCGHVCLCSQCFGKVISCPVCRGPIHYYFKTREEVTVQ